MAAVKSKTQSEEEQISILRVWEAASKYDRILELRGWVEVLEVVADKALGEPKLSYKSKVSIKNAGEKLPLVVDRLMKVAEQLPEQDRSKFVKDLSALSQYSAEILQLGTWPEGHDSIAAIRSGRHANLGGQKADAPRLDTVREIIAEVDARLPELSIKTRNNAINMRLVEMINPSTKEKMTTLGEKALRGHRKNMRNT